MSGFVKGIIKSGLGIFTSRVFGLLRDIAVAGFYGASSLTDAFFVAFAVPNLFRAFFAEGALSSAFVPFLSDNIRHHGIKKANNYLSSLILAVSLMITVILILTAVFPEYIVIAFMPGYSGDTGLISEASKMIVLLMPYLMFVTICALLSGFLNLKGSYYIPYSSTALLNIAMITGAWIGYTRGVDILWLCYGVIAGGVLQLIYVGTFAFVKGFRVNFSGGINTDVRKTFLLVVPSLAGVGINQLNFLVGRVIASFLAVGSISYLYYANRLFQFPLGMFAVAVGTVTLTEISKANSDGDTYRRNGLIDKAINAIFLIMLPAGAGLITLADPIVDIVYSRMEFGGQDVSATASALRMYTIGLLFYSFINVFSRVFHSEKDMKTPVKAAFLGLVANVVFNLILMKPLGHSGIALASSIAAFVNCAYLYFSLRGYSYGLLKNKTILFKLVSASFVMGAGVVAASRLGLHIIPVILLGVLIYFSFLKISRLKIKEVIR
jgi:putative peptidoglycan lipid II flippase